MEWPCPCMLWAGRCSHWKARIRARRGLRTNTHCRGTPGPAAPSCIPAANHRLHLRVPCKGAVLLCTTNVPVCIPSCYPQDMPTVSQALAVPTHPAAASGREFYERWGAAGYRLRWRRARLRIDRRHDGLRGGTHLGRSRQSRGHARGCRRRALSLAQCRPVHPRPDRGCHCRGWRAVRHRVGEDRLLGSGLRVRDQWIRCSLARRVQPAGVPGCRGRADGRLPLHHPGATDTRAPKGFAPLAIGLALTLIHLVSIPITNTSVNPARSIGPALFAGSAAISQLWLFVLAPIAGALIAGFSYARVLGRGDAVPLPRAAEG
jgi:hypothetical protein